MENTYTFDDYTVKVNKYCEVYLYGKVHYTATWVDGTTDTHYGKINCCMELEGVKIDYLEIASYEMTAKTGEGADDPQEHAAAACGDDPHGD